MKTVNIRREDLLSKVKENRETHKTLFAEAMEGYREDAIKQLTSMLKDAKSGKEIRLYASLETPIDKTEDYDTVIAMLEMSSDDIIELANHEFNSYVLDKWGWKDAFNATVSSYRKEFK